MKRNSLVLTTESAGHPFRQRLPMHVLRPLARGRAETDEQDWKLFLLSFAAFFTVFYSFIS
jgi:hypothetical protein